MFGRGAGAGAAGAGAGAAAVAPPLAEVCSAGDFVWDETTLSNMRTFATNSSEMKQNTNTSLAYTYAHNLGQDSSM